LSIEQAFQFGLPTVLLIALCILIYKFLDRLFKTVEHKLFDDIHGILPIWLRQNAKFLDGIAERHEKQLKMCEVHGKAIVKLSTDFNKKDDFSTVDTNAALHYIINSILIYMRSKDVLKNGEKAQIEDLLASAKARLERNA
jgi:hypothetical protein